MKKQKWLSLMLTVVLVMTMCPVNAYAAETESGIRVTSSTAATSSYDEPMLVTETYDLDGDETYDSVYEIATASELEWFAAHVNNNNMESNAVLVADIDLTGYTHTPIGVNYSDFKGIFDGQGYTIKNMKFTTVQNGYNNHPTYDYQGLFGVLRSGAIVRNFTVKGEITLAANGQKYIGGAVGLAYEGTTISNVISYVDIKDGRKAYENISQVGGVVGQLGTPGDNGTAATVENCKYYGKIDIDTAASVGGIAGQGVKNSTVSGCINYGTVGWNYIGHAAGVIGSAQTGTTVKDCVNYGSVSIIRNDCIGGIVGYANEDVTITSCVNIGTVTAKKSTIPNEPDVYLGGILGYVNNSKFSGLTDCFNYGTVNASDNGKTYTGAIVGYVKSSASTSVIKNNYWYTSSCTSAYGSGGNKPATPTAANVVTRSTTTWNTGWYVVTANVTVSSRIRANGDVKLLLANGKTLTAEKGIDVLYPEDATNFDKLTIYACTENSNMGKLVARADQYNAAIGGRFDSSPKTKYGYGTITINGGEITATGGYQGAGIGGGRESLSYQPWVESMGDHYSYSHVIINGGKVNAQGGSGAPGIGAGAEAEKSGWVTINGGTVKATGGSGGAGIGNGQITGVENPLSANGRVFINGGTVTATGGKNGAGIGCGDETKDVDVTITGGTVKAVGTGIAAGIGKGSYKGSSGGAACSVSIYGGTVTAIGGGGDNVTAYCYNSPGKLRYYRYYRICYGKDESSASYWNRIKETMGIDYNDANVAMYVRIEPCSAHQSSGKGTVQDADYHIGDCQLCRRKYVEKHSFTDGKCICGMETLEPKLDESGTQAVYEIRTAGELLSFAATVNSDTSKTYTAKLMNDISLSGMTYLPINLYRGSFDGQGYSITGGGDLYAYENCGLFRETYGADIRNLSLKNWRISCASNGDNGIEAIGGVVGKACGGTKLSNVSVAGNFYPRKASAGASSFKSVSYIGGIVGKAEGGITIENCVSGVTILSSSSFTFAGETCSYAGGIAGAVYGGTTAVPSRITGCTYENCGTTKMDFQKVEITTSYIGGIVGYAGDVTVIERCTNSGTKGTSGIIKGKSPSGYGTGGIAGSGEKLTIRLCRNLGDITGSTVAYVGGILGSVNDAGFGGVSNCYNYSEFYNYFDEKVTGAIIGYIGSATPTEGISDNYYWKWKGYRSNDVPAFGTNSTKSGGAEKSSGFVSGEVTYRLNGGVTDGTQVWYQTKGTDNYPQFEGKTIYYNEAANPQYYNARIGDANCDSYIDVRDIIGMKKNLESGKYPESADLNSDGKVDADDMVKLKKYLLTGSMSAS